jgi:hypothetical protein
VELTLLDQALLHAGGDAVAEEDAIRHDHPAAASRLEGPLDHLDEQQRGLAGPGRGWEVGLDALLLLASERGVGDHHIDLRRRADLAQGHRERILAPKVGMLDLV